MSLRIVLIYCLSGTLLACQPRSESPGNKELQGENTGPTLSDPDATPMAEALYANLYELSASHVLLGHQDALAYGMGWKGEEFRSDIHDVLGDHPAVFGWDLGHMGYAENIDGVPFEDMKRWARTAFEKGGINTYSWHMRNYAVSGSSWDTDSCVEACLPGGAMHELYLEKLDLAAGFFSSLKNAQGELIPVLFRPFHEMTGSWFWWGKGNCSATQYKELFRFTIDYLRNTHHLHQLIIVYSPDKFRTAEEYMDFYPGDEYVDVMALDDYQGFSTRRSSAQTVRRLEIMDSLSAGHHKLMAVSETGLETLPNEKWFTEVVLPTLNSNASTRRAAWILFWRNGRPDHFYAPYPGHASAPDFIEFMNHDLMLSLSELPDVYK
jgi:mannan endo-1,4-beta-mannosidase